MKRKKDSDQKASLREILSKKFDIDTDVFRGEGRVEIKGRNCVEVRGVRRIAVYSEECVKLDMGRSYLNVFGKRMECVSFSNAAVCIKGFIESVGFEGVKNGRN